MLQTGENEHPLGDMHGGCIASKYPTQWGIALAILESGSA
jgi:hypothetical protein